MAEPGLAVAPTPASNTKQQHGESTIDRMSIAHRLTAVAAATDSPLKPTHDTNQQYTNNSSDHISTNDNSQATKTDTALDANDAEQAQPQPDNISTSSSGLDSFETAVEQMKIERVEQAINVDSSSSSGHQLATIKPPDGPTSVTVASKKSRYEETIIDGFAICAFKSWEDLQDELNERIASNKANKANTVSEKSSCDKIIKKKRKDRPKTGQEIKCPGDTSGSFSQTKVSKAAKKDKNGLLDRIHNKRKGSNDNSAEFATNSMPKKPRESNSGASRSSQGSDKKSSASSLLREETNSTSNAHHSINGGVENYNQTKASRSAANDDQLGTHTSQSPKVQQHRDNDARKSRTQDKMLNQDMIRNSSNRSQTAYSPSGSNPQRSMFEDTSNANHLPTKMSPHDQRNDRPDTGFGINQNSHPQSAESRQARSQHAIPSPTTHHVQSQMPYGQSTMYTPPHPHQSPSQSMNHHVPHYGNPMQHRPPHSYFSAPIGAHAPTVPNPAQNIQPSTSSSSSTPYRYPTLPPYNYASPYHSPNNPYYYRHDGRSIQPPYPFSMYPPYHQPIYPQHSSSVVSSTRMSSLPSPFGPPYVVTDTTISKQTSIVPATFQQAASSMTDRFGHHPNATHAMSPFSAPTTAQSHPQPSSLYASPQIPPEKSFFQLTPNHGGATGTKSANPSNFLGLPGSTYQPIPAANYASSMYGPNRWPAATIDHQHAAARFSSFYPSSTAALLDRASAFGGYGARPPPFPAGMFPPAPF